MYITGRFVKKYDFAVTESFGVDFNPKSIKLSVQSYSF